MLALLEQEILIACEQDMDNTTHMELIVSTLDTFQLFKSRLNEVAKLNLPANLCIGIEWM